MRRLRMVAAAVLVLLAVLTQYTASLKVAVEEETIAAFWHQVAWRAPQIREATGLLVHYPGVNYGEDVDAVNGPANFIYFPEPTNELPVRYKLYAMEHYPWTAKEYLAAEDTRFSYRTHYGIIDYDYLLVLTQPTNSACVRVIDRRWPWFSADDPDDVLIVGQNSNAGNIIPQGETPRLSPTIFGPEPEHGWCYSFQKASLAAQEEDWPAVLAVRDEAQRAGQAPADPLEWMPFAQAEAALGEAEAFAESLQKMIDTPFQRKQVCNVLTAMREQGYRFQGEIQAQIDGGPCKPPSR